MARARALNLAPEILSPKSWVTIRDAAHDRFPVLAVALAGARL